MTFDTYAIADAAFIDQRTVGDWFKSHVSFITVIKSKEENAS